MIILDLDPMPFSFAADDGYSCSTTAVRLLTYCYNWLFTTRSSIKLRKCAIICVMPIQLMEYAIFFERPLMVHELSPCRLSVGDLSSGIQVNPLWDFIQICVRREFRFPSLPCRTFKAVTHLLFPFAFALHSSPDGPLPSTTFNFFLFNFNVFLTQITFSFMVEFCEVYR